MRARMLKNIPSPGGDMDNSMKKAHLSMSFGTSKGNRTPDFALRGQRLNRLTMEAYMAGELGFEPRQYESES